jgi:adenylylsulfate kinase
VDQQQSLSSPAFSITKEKRQFLHGHKSCILWFTGLSGSGKSTIANRVEMYLYELGVSTYILDGDNFRKIFNRDLGFSANDRKENIVRAGNAARLILECGIIVLAAFISPYREDREMVRKSMNDHEFIEVYVDCPIEICEQRDPKGLYQRARKGEIRDFTGISAPYESPLTPEIILKSDPFSVEECAQQVIRYLVDHAYLSTDPL